MLLFGDEQVILTIRNQLTCGFILPSPKNGSEICITSCRFENILDAMFQGSRVTFTAQGGASKAIFNVKLKNTIENKTGCLYH